MDILYASLLSLFVLVSFSIFLYKSKPTKDGKVLPPGQTGWPIIGESIEFLNTGWKGHPEKFIFDRMSKFSPIVIFISSQALEILHHYISCVSVHTALNHLKHLEPSKHKKIRPQL